MPLTFDLVFRALLVLLIPSLGPTVAEISIRNVKRYRDGTPKSVQTL